MNLEQSGIGQYCKNIDSEIIPLKEILEKIAALPKRQAFRILQYCLEYLKDDNEELKTWTDVGKIVEKIRLDPQ